VSENGTCRVVLCDDAPGVLQLTELVLVSEPGIEVVATATNGREAVERCRELRPDVLLLDISMPVMDGLTALPLVKQASPRTRVLVFSAFDSPEMRERAQAQGAAGYVRKGATPAELTLAVRALAG
jgi:DNA-binding NarL/FixJ family response regulator